MGWRMFYNGWEPNALLQAMSTEQFVAFQEAVKADADLQKKLKAAKDVDAVVAIAKAAGFTVSRLDMSLPWVLGFWLGGDQRSGFWRFVRGR